MVVGYGRVDRGKSMRIKPIYWIALALAFALFFAVCDGLRTRDKYSVVVGQLEEAVKVKDAVIVEKDKLIEQANGVIAGKDKALVASKQAEADLRAKIGKKDAALLNLEQSLTQAQTDAERVPILTSMVETWAAKYADLEKVVTEKDTVVTAWVTKYNAQVQISDAWKAKYEATARVLSLSENALKSSNRKLRRNQIVSNVSKVALVGLGGYVLFDKLKGE